MRSSLYVAALVAPTVLAFPWLKPEGLDALLKHPEAQAEIRRRLQEREAISEEPRQLKTGLLPGLVDVVSGTLGAVLDPVLGLIPKDEAVNGLKRFPEGLLFAATGLYSAC